jgi:hypothetical protein
MSLDKGFGAPERCDALTLGRLRQDRRLGNCHKAFTNQGDGHDRIDSLARGDLLQSAKQATNDPLNAGMIIWLFIEIGKVVENDHLVSGH